MSTIKRNYNGKDVDMLVTVSTILETAISNKTFLQTKRSTWADPYFADLKTRIDTAIQNYLGVDSAKDLRLSTVTVNSIQTNAIKDLAEVKIQIIEDYKADKQKRDEILKELGFTSYHKDAQKGNQEALINLLFQFKINLSASLKATFVSNGIPTTILDAINGKADQLKNANVNQETYKGNRKTITASAIKEFNEIYDLVISIGKIASKFYKGQPDMQKQFSYNGIHKNLNAHASKPTAKETPSTK